MVCWIRCMDCDPNPAPLQLAWPPSWLLDSWRHHGRTNLSLFQVSVEGLFHHGIPIVIRSPTRQNTATRNTDWTTGLLTTIVPQCCPETGSFGGGARISMDLKMFFSSWAMCSPTGCWGSPTGCSECHMSFCLSCTKGTNHQAHVGLRWTVNVQMIHEREEHGGTKARQI